MSVTIASPTKPPAARTSRADRKSISSRLGSFFSPKSSHINKFAIELDEDDHTYGIKKYGPGETISGKVVLDVGRPLGVTHVVISLEGIVEVFKNHEKYRGSDRIAKSRSGTERGKRWVSEYYGDGFVSLLEDEVILCGEGRLDAKLYHFRFNIDFPKRLGLPSSIEFERGRIGYHLTATITRPATITPTTTYVRHIDFQDNIDIAILPAPKPREATLRPVEKTASTNATLRLLTSIEPDRLSQSSTPSASTPIILESGDSPIADPTAATAVSSRSSSASLAAGSTRVSVPRSSHTGSTTTSAYRKPLAAIHTTVRLSRSGCLAGQTVWVFVTIENHNRAIRSIKGVLATLYRESRVDMHPHLPLGHASSAAKKYEDYYPRSRTGLGGLSLSAAGSSQVWRKDLSQTTAPLIINPQTMSAEVKVPVRIPPEVFPSIRHVPGEMISFKYFVEVVIDIQGKLFLNEMTSPAGVTSSTPSTGPVLSSAATEVGGSFDRSQMSVGGERCIDTTSLRRDKRAILIQCDLVVGTCDSASSDGKQNLQPPIPQTTPYTTASHDHGYDEQMVGSDAASRQHPGLQHMEPHTADRRPHYGAPEFREGQTYDSQWDSYAYDPYYYYDGYDYGYADYDPGYYDQHPYNSGRPPEESDDFQSSVPIPPSAEEQGLSEKERLRRAEASLLPSQPPLQDGPSDFSTTGCVPSAPFLPDEYAPSLEQGNSRTTGGPTRRIDSPDRLVQSEQQTAISTDAPSVSQMSSTIVSGSRTPTDDEQEVETERLTVQASSPETSAALGPRVSTQASAPAPDDMRDGAMEAATRDSTDEAQAEIERWAGQPRAEPHLTSNDSSGEFLPRYER